MHDYSSKNIIDLTMESLNKDKCESIQLIEIIDSPVKKELSEQVMLEPQGLYRWKVKNMNRIVKIMSIA